jgi:DNA invertase Pin-like site-specific DNA recombinase
MIGYARVSTSDQKLDMQRDELKRAGCRRIFTDVISGAHTDAERQLDLPSDDNYIAPSLAA